MGSVDNIEPVNSSKTSSGPGKDMKTKILKPKDFLDALNIARRNSHFFNKQGLESMEKDLKSDVVIGAFLNEEMVGFISFKELNHNVIEISWIAIKPELQGKGIGSRLFEDGLKSLTHEYKVCEVKTLSEIDPDQEYAKTREFYKKLGFISLETINPYPDWGKNNPCQIFIKIL